MIPDSITPVVGFRAWRLTQAGLVSVVHGGRWSHKEPEVAWCSDRTGAFPGFQVIFPFSGGGARVLPPAPASAEHLAPDEKCSCGIYATAQLEDLKSGTLHLGIWGRQNYVLGIVEGYGKVILHDKGWRAERARIRQLCVWRGMPDGWRSLVVETAASYGVGLAWIEEGTARALGGEEPKPTHESPYGTLDPGWGQLPGRKLFVPGHVAAAASMRDFARKMSEILGSWDSWGDHGCLECGRRVAKASSHYCSLRCRVRAAARRAVAV